MRSFKSHWNFFGILLLLLEFLTSAAYFLDCGITSHAFEEVIEERTVAFKIIKLKECLFVWISDKGIFDDLSVAMKTPYDSVPISTRVMGQSIGDESCSLAQHLSRKTGKQVFASCNISQSNSKIDLCVRKRLMNELTNNPENF